MEKSEKLDIAQKYIDGMNELVIRFAPEGETIDSVNGKRRYIKKTGRYFTGQELKYMKKIHDEINNGLILKLDENEKEITDFDDSENGKPKAAKAKEKMKEKFEDESDMDDIVDIYFDPKNKDKVGNNAKVK